MSRLVDISPYENCRIVLNNEDGGFPVSELPTVDAVEVVRGKWNIIMERAGKSCLALCSICGAQETAPSRVALVFGHRYCRYCGAKMEGTDANT